MSGRVEQVGTEPTLVLCSEGVAGQAARRMMPRLPEACFVPPGDRAVAEVRRAADQGVKQVILMGLVDELAAVLPDVFGEITTAMGGSAELAARAAAGDPGQAYELWESAGLLGTCGRELCRRVADTLEHGGGDAPLGEPARGPVAVQVVLLDTTGQRMIGMYGRLAR